MWGGLICWTLCWTSPSRTCMLASFPATRGMAWGLRDCWKTGTAGYDTYPRMQSQKISALSTLPTLLQGNISFSYVTMCYFNVMGRLGRFSAFLCIHRTWPWKVLPVGKPQSLHKTPAGSVATLCMQHSRHAEHFPRTRAISNQTRSWDCSSAGISACHTNSCCFSGPCTLLAGCVSLQLSCSGS